MGMCHTWERGEMHARFWWETLKVQLSLGRPIFGRDRST